MTNPQTYTLEDAQLHFAKSLNRTVWELLERPWRSRAEDEMMVHAAHASCYHWLQIGTGLQHQRGEWLIAHVYTELGIVDAALRHAARCLEITKEFPDQMRDFDRAYGYEAVARANALAGNQKGAQEYLRLAEEAAQAIRNSDDRKNFFGDFNGGNWYGLR
jgi:hypothetical protein